MTPQEALDRIGVLCDEAEANRWSYPDDNGLTPLATYKLRAILAEVDFAYLMGRLEATQ